MVNPDSRRIIVSAWNVGEIENMALPPCHAFFQFYVANGKLSCQLYQRSADIFLGVPFNIASYALLTMMVADQANLEYGEFIHTFGDAHIYLNHKLQVEQQLKRSIRTLPQMIIKKNIPSIFEYKFNDFILETDNYGFIHNGILERASLSKSNNSFRIIIIGGSSMFNKSFFCN